MSVLFWVLLGALGAVLLVLVVTHDSAAVLGLEQGTFAAIAYSVILLVFLGGALRLRSTPIGRCDRSTT